MDLNILVKHFSSFVLNSIFNIKQAFHIIPKAFHIILLKDKELWDVSMAF